MTQPTPGGTFVRFERHEDLGFLTLVRGADADPDHLLGPDTQALLLALRANPPRGLVFDLSEVETGSSLLVSFLMRCHKRVKEGTGGAVVVGGASPRARELLHFTALDTLWPIFDTPAGALDALRRAAPPGD
jgi:anti-anti-sigma regulatory factor